jgi:hypothetical protein
MAFFNLENFMRCHLVIAKDADENIIAKRVAATSALARETREELMEQFCVRKKDVTIEPHDVPVAKNDLIGYLNAEFEIHDISGETGED